MRIKTANIGEENNIETIQNSVMNVILELLLR